MKCTMLKSVIRRFQGAPMRCSKSVFGHFSANLPFSAIFPKITSLNDNGRNSAWNRLRTSHESSPKPSDHTLQHGALHYWLFDENGCVQGRFCLHAMHAMHAIEFENFFSWFSTKFDLFSMILNQTQLIRNTHSIWPSASKKLKNYRKLQFILENIGFCDGLERGSRA